MCLASCWMYAWQCLSASEGRGGRGGGVERSAEGMEFVYLRRFQSEAALDETMGLNSSRI